MTGNRFYVYVHKYKSGPKQGQIFYVGKGAGTRIYSNSSRNQHWHNVVNKYGRISEKIHVGLSEPCSLTMERIEIGKHGIENLCNITEGGDGAEGIKVYCSNGMVFDSITEAAYWASEKTGQKPLLSGISLCARNKSNSAFGLGWSFINDVSEPISQKVLRKNKNPDMIGCSNGMVFSGMSEVKDYIKEKNNGNFCSSNIRLSIRNKNNTAYGYKWSYIDATK